MLNASRVLSLVILVLGAGGCYLGLRVLLALLGRLSPAAWLFLDDHLRLTDRRVRLVASALLTLAVFGAGLAPASFNPLTDPAAQSPRTPALMPVSALRWPTPSTGSGQAPAATVSPYTWEESYTATVSIASLPPAEQRRLCPVDMPLWPRPPNDNGRGLHWFPTTMQRQEVVDRFVPELVAMRIRWVVVLNGSAEWDIHANDYLVTRLRAAGIMPILRIVADVGPLDPALVRDVVRHYRPLGVYYYQLFNEPNLHDQWTACQAVGVVPEPHSPERFAACWLPLAQVVVDEQALAGLAPMSPGGDMSDYEFLQRSLAYLARQGQWRVLARTWIGLHNYTFGVPPDYVRDEQGFARYRRYNAIVAATLGESRPILSTEAGPAPADGRWNPDPGAFTSGGRRPTGTVTQSVR